VPRFSDTSCKRVVSSRPGNDAVFMGSHTEHYKMKEKYAAIGKGTNPFTDSEGYLNAIDNYERVFNYKLEQQTKK
jgi:hypothetical protein